MDGYLVIASGVFRYYHNIFVGLQENCPKGFIKVGKEKRRKMQARSSSEATPALKKQKTDGNHTQFHLFRSSLILQDAKLLPLATAVPHAALAAVSLAVESVFGLLLLRGVEEQAASTQGFGVVEEDVGFVLVHFAEDDDVGRVVLWSLLAWQQGWKRGVDSGLTRSYSHGMS
jgi:hypothetical protein